MRPYFGPGFGLTRVKPHCVAALFWGRFCGPVFGPFMGSMRCRSFITSCVLRHCFGGGFAGRFLDRLWGPRVAEASQHHVFPIVCLPQRAVLVCSHNISQRKHRARRRFEKMTHEDMQDPQTGVRNRVLCEFFKWHPRGKATSVAIPVRLLTGITFLRRECEFADLMGVVCMYVASRWIMLHMRSRRACTSVA